jgi:hypothetical protein
MAAALAIEDLLVHSTVAWCPAFVQPTCPVDLTCRYSRLAQRAQGPVSTCCSSDFTATDVAVPEPQLLLAAAGYNSFRFDFSGECKQLIIFGRFACTETT